MAEKKLSILEKALQHIPSSEKLLLVFMDAMSVMATKPQMLTRWMPAGLDSGLNCVVRLSGREVPSQSGIQWTTQSLSCITPSCGYLWVHERT